LSAKDAARGRARGRGHAKPADQAAAPAVPPRPPLVGASFPKFVVSWNQQQGRGTPDVHLRMARWLDERWAAGDRRLLMVFRDAGKSRWSACSAPGCSAGTRTCGSWSCRPNPASRPR
jgi:hypothetical protein